MEFQKISQTLQTSCLWAADVQNIITDYKLEKV